MEYITRFVGDITPLSFSYKKREPKKVLVFDEHGNIIAKFDSIRDASKKLNIVNRTLRYALAHSGLLMSKGTIYKVSFEQ